MLTGMRPSVNNSLPERQRLAFNTRALSLTITRPDQLLNPNNSESLLERLSNTPQRLRQDEQRV